MLEERETELLSKLDQIEARYRGDGITEQTDELNQLKEIQLATAKRNENKDLVMQHVAELDNRVKKLREDWKKERASMWRVELEWDAELETGLSKLGAIRVSAFRDYKTIENPVIVAGAYSLGISESAGVFCNPLSIAIHPETNNVYVCDAGFNFRVQVFTKSLEFLFDFSEKMKFPFGICISNNSVYITQYGSHCLNKYTAEGKFLKSAGKEGKKKLEFFHPRGVDASNDKNRFYIGEWGNNRIQCLNFNLTFNSIISDIPQPLDIKLTAEEIVVLAEGEHCIRYYNFTHQLIRKIIPRGGGHVTDPGYLCLDAQQNILITDSIAHCILIFTSKGELIHKFGREGTKRGELVVPQGIAVDSENRIIIASFNPNYCLQIF